MPSVWHSAQPRGQGFENEKRTHILRKVYPLQVWMTPWEWMPIGSEDGSVAQACPVIPEMKPVELFNQGREAI